jgi:hypothetical protein
MSIGKSKERYNMSGGRKIFITILVMLFVLSFYSHRAFASEIEIKPVLEGQEYYTMKLGQVQTFEAFGVGWDKDRAERVPGLEINSIRWSFDARFLEAVDKKDNTITLRAIKQRTSKLTVTGEVTGKQVTKTIFVVIGERE